MLTLDEKIQYIAEKELTQAIHETQAKAGTVIVENPNTGELLAMANWPTFNPNAAKDSNPESRMDRAASALYEPGSVFKIVTLSAAIDQGVTSADEMVDCQNGAIYIAGHRIRDHKPFGLLSVAQILQYSSDVGAIKVGLRLGAPKFYNYIQAYGFGQPTGVGFLITAKSILRFGDVKESTQRKLTEYIIIGTFMSFGWGLAIAVLTQLGIQHWLPAKSN